MEHIYDRIRTERIKRGYSQEYMADKLGITQTGYNKIERGKTQISILRLKQIAQVFELPEDELKTGVVSVEDPDKRRDKEAQEKNAQLEAQVILLKERNEELQKKLELATAYLQESYAFFNYLFKVFISEELNNLPPEEITLDRINKVWINSISTFIDDREKMKQLDIDSPRRLALRNTDIRDTLWLLRDDVWLILKLLLPKDHPLLSRNFH